MAESVFFNACPNQTYVWNEDNFTFQLSEGTANAECPAQIPLSIESAEDALEMLESTPDDAQSLWWKLNSYLTGMQVSVLSSVPTNGHRFRIDAQPGYTEGSFKSGRKSGRDEALSLVHFAQPESLNPLRINGTEDRIVANLIYEPLFRYSRDNPEKVEPALAEECEQISPNTFRIKIRPGVKWTDNHQDTTIDDFLFTFQVLLDPKFASPRRGFFLVNGQAPTFEKVDQYTAIITFAGPIDLKQRLVDFNLIPAHRWQETYQQKGLQGVMTVNPEKAPQEAVGNGAFKLVSLSSDQSVIFKANPDYYRVDRNGTRLPYIEKVVINIVPAKPSQLTKFAAQRERVNMLPLISTNAYAYLAKPETKDGRKWNLFHSSGSLMSFYIYFNLLPGANNDGEPYVHPQLQAVFADLEFRKAFDSLIDRSHIQSIAFAGFPAQQHCLPPPGLELGYNCAERKHVEIEQISPAVFAEVAKRHGLVFDEQEKFYKFTRGPLSGERFSLHLYYPTTSPEREAVAQIVKNLVEKAGLEVLPLGEPSLGNRVNNTHEWDALVYAWAMSVPSEEEVLFAPSGEKRTWYPNKPQALWEPWEKSVAEWFTQLQDASTDADIRKFWHPIIQAVDAQYVVLPIAYVPVLAVADNSLCNTAMMPHSGAPLHYNIEELFWMNSRGECAPE